MIGKKLGFMAALLAALLLVGAQVAQGLIIDPNNAYYGDEYKAWAKFRKDIGKQSAKLTQCYTKAFVKCIGATDPATTVAEWPGRCNPQDPNSSTTNADAKAAFGEALAKCDSKLLFAKKNPADPNAVVGYRDIGCPCEDPNWLAVDLDEYQDDTITSTRKSVGEVAASVPGVCFIFGAPASGQALKDCLTAFGKAAEKTVKSVFKCQEKCENDLVNKKGNGGGTDDQNTTCAATPALSDPPPTGPFYDCVVKALAKGQKLADKNENAGNAWGTAMGSTLPKVDDSTNDLYNECRCGVGVGPCP